MKASYLKKNILTAAVLMGVTALFAGNVSAQTSSQPQQSGVTRAQVENELAQLEAVGYRPIGDKNTHPYPLEAAEARLKAGQVTH